MVTTSIITSLLAIAYRYVCILDNRKKDKAGIKEDYEHAYEDDLTDMKVSELEHNVRGNFDANRDVRIHNSDIRSSGTAGKSLRGCAMARLGICVTIDRVSRSRCIGYSCS